MSYKLLIEKLRRSEHKIVTREELANDCKTLNIRYEYAIGYLLKHGYLVKILRGIFYAKNVEEREYKTIKMSYKEAIARAFAIKEVKNWYFGLESALKINNLTHEYIAKETIISDKIFRSKLLLIFNHPIRFIKAKRELFSFGIKKDHFPYSDIEKTILDIIYFDKYNGRKDSEIRNRIAEYTEHISKHKLKEYGKHYPKSVQAFIGDI